MCLSNNIRYLRKKHNYSQEFIAEKLGYKSYTTIQKWEMGVSEPSIAKLRILAELFGVDINDMTGKNIENSENSNSTLTPKDERDIARDLDMLMGKIETGEDSPLYYNGEEVDQESKELLRDAIGMSLRHLKIINKEKYNPHKNKKVGD